MPNLIVYKVVVIVLVAGIAGSSGIASYYYQQQATRRETVLRDADQINTYLAQINGQNSQIASLNKQIDALNSQIFQLQALNNQLGGNNAQLISQIEQLQSQVNQLRSEVSQLQAEITNLTAIIKLQNSRVIASQVSIWGSGSTVGNPAFINLGTLTYSGYLRVSWTGAHASFSIQEFDVNITTPITTSGIFSIPVSANATGNSWFTDYDCSPIPAGTFCNPVTYSITYWY